MNRGRRVSSTIGLVVVALLGAAAFAPAVLAADSSLGDRAGAWPSSWSRYLLATGSVVSDPIGDVGCGSGYCDVSGASGSSSVYWASDGTNVFFRIRVVSDPRRPAAGGFRSTAYVLQIAVNRTLVAAVGLDAKPAQRDFVYVANADGTNYREIYAFPFDSSGGEVSNGARAIPDGIGGFFVDWQVPISRITQQSGGAITATTPVQLFFGTSQSANLSVINKDYMFGDTVDFSGGSTIVFVPPATAVVPPAPGAPPQQPSQPTSPPGTAPGPAPLVPLLPNTATQPASVPWRFAAVAALTLGLSLAAGRRPPKTRPASR